MLVTPPWGAMTCQAENDASSRLPCGRGVSETIYRAFRHPRVIPINNKKHASHSNSLFWLMFGFGTGVTVVAGVGIADGSRAIHDVGI